MKRYQKAMDELEKYIDKNGLASPEGGWKLKDNKENKKLIEDLIEWNFSLDDNESEDIKKEKKKVSTELLKTHYGYYRINLKLLWDFLMESRI